MAPIFTSLLFFKLNLKPRSKTLRPPLLVLLGTNDSDPPTEQDISRIRDGIARVESKLKKEGLHVSGLYTKFLKARQQKLQSDCVYALSTDFNYIPITYEGYKSDYPTRENAQKVLIQTWCRDKNRGLCRICYF